MPNNWNTYKLGEVADIIMGQSPKSEFYNNTKLGLPFLQGNRTFGSLYPTFDTYTTDAKKIAEKGDVLFSVRAPVGDINIANKRICIGRGLCSFRLKKGENLFLLYLLKYYKNNIVNQESGTVFGSVNKDTLSSIEILFPENLQEQQSIASILSAIDDKIENNLAINKTLEEMAMALYKHWFVDFGPFQDGEFEESELGMIPKGWEVKRLDEVAYKRVESYKFKGKEKVVFVNTGDVLDGSFLHKNYMDVDELPGQAKKAIYPEDILFSEIRPINRRFAYVDFDSEDYVVSTKFMVIRNNELINNKLLYRILTRNETLIEFQNIAESRSGTFPQITFDVVGHIQMILPNIEIQEEFQSIVGNWEEQQQLNLKEIKNLTQLRDTLLPQLISGAVRLKEFRE